MEEKTILELSKDEATENSCGFSVFSSINT